jgi:hypothetical protein
LYFGGLVFDHTGLVVDIGGYFGLEGDISLKLFRNKVDFEDFREEFLKLVLQVVFVFKFVLHSGLFLNTIIAFLRRMAPLE